MTTSKPFAKKWGVWGIAGASVLGAAALVIAACQGEEGVAGPQGTNGAQGAAGQPGPQGAQGNAGTPGTPGAGVDGGLATSCMLPCHGFNNIVDQWKTSTHFIGAITNDEEVPTWTSPGGTCGNCHASDGLPTRLGGSVNIQGDAGPIHLTAGQLNYRAPNGSVTEATYAGQSKVASIGCMTCHNITATNDPHVTGAVYAKGTLLLRVGADGGVDAGGGDQVFIEKSPTAADAGPVTGTGVGFWRASNTCMACHKSRKDVSNYIVASQSITSRHWGPHEAPQADVFSGQGGYHFASKTYKSSSHQSTEGCTACHMAKVASNNNYPDHSMAPKLASCKNAGCHPTATSFDTGPGGPGDLKRMPGGRLVALRDLLNARGLLTRSSASPYLPLSGTELTDGHFELDRSRPGGGGADGGAAPLTANEAGALYNYFLVSRGSGYAIHNPLYVNQLLFDSIEALGGTPAFSRPN
jgi:hypothetical protein